MQFFVNCVIFGMVFGFKYENLSITKSTKFIYWQSYFHTFVWTYDNILEDSSEQFFSKTLEEEYNLPGG